MEMWCERSRAVQAVLYTFGEVARLEQQPKALVHGVNDPGRGVTRIRAPVRQGQPACPPRLRGARCNVHGLAPHYFKSLIR